MVLKRSNLFFNIFLFCSYFFPLDLYFLAFLHNTCSWALSICICCCVQQWGNFEKIVSELILILIKRGHHSKLTWTYLNWDNETEVDALRLLTIINIMLKKDLFFVDDVRKYDEPMK